MIHNCPKKMSKTWKNTLSDKNEPGSFLSSESFFSKLFSTFFSCNFSIFHIFLFFFQINIGMLTNLIFLLLENSRIVIERLRISIHISNYFQTLEIMEKTLSDKNEPQYPGKQEDTLFGTHAQYFFYKRNVRSKI